MSVVHDDLALLRGHAKWIVDMGDRDGYEAAVKRVEAEVARLQSRVYVLENMRPENYIETLEAAEAEVARLEQENGTLRELVAGTGTDLEAAEAQALDLAQLSEEQLARALAAEAEVARLEHDNAVLRELPSRETVRRAEAAEAEIARLRDGRKSEPNDIDVFIQRAEAAEAEAAHQRLLREDAEALAARLRDGLRRIAERCESEDYADEEQAVYASREARALLAEDGAAHLGPTTIQTSNPFGTARVCLDDKDGAAQEDYEACCDHDRIAGRDVICDLPLGHDGPHQMGGARWRRAKDGA